MQSYCHSGSYKTAPRFGFLQLTQGCGRELIHILWSEDFGARTGCSTGRRLRIIHSSTGGCCITGCSLTSRADDWLAGLGNLIEWLSRQKQ